MRRGSIILLGLAFSQGCSSSYEPARSPRIVTVVEGGQPTFVKNGEHFGGPAFGSGLAEAVEGNAEAEHQATVGRNLVLGGFVLDLVGLGTMIGGTVVLAKNDTSPEPHADAAGTALLVGGAVAVLAGSVLILCGQPHIYDAVNIYNDGLEQRLTAPPLMPVTTPPTIAPPAAAPPSTPAPAALPPAAAPPAAPLPGPRASLISHAM
ncbi:MAG TPA: hypothetical protein VER96_11950 [Polyangiaceae bacterium]|nr:hypothetical protein [Polyangiaceae bacterium]